MPGGSHFCRHQRARKLRALDPDQYRRSSEVSDHQPEDSCPAWTDLHWPGRMTGNQSRFERTKESFPDPTGSNVVESSTGPHSHLWYICLRSVRPAEQDGSRPDAHAGSGGNTLSNTVAAVPIESHG